MESKKLTAEELNELKEIQMTQEGIISSLGQIETQKQILKNKKDNILNQFSTLQEKQSEVAKNLQEKYGDGNINIETGEFTPNK